MKTRIITGLILAAMVIILLMLQNNLLLCAVISLIAAAMTFELIRALECHRIYPFLIINLLFSLALPFMVMQQTIKYLPLVVPLYLTISLFFVMLSYTKLDMKKIGLFYTEHMLISFGIGSLTLLKLNFGADSTFYIIMAMLFAFITDAGAYFTGRALGKHKLSPHVSPHKTVEGSIGGVIISLVICTGVTLGYKAWFLKESAQINYVGMIVLTLLASLSSMIGDLMASAIKRSCGIKDFGKLLPGHGGMLDRLDSLMFTTPITLGFISLFPIVSR
ncbi:MAG: phosphatidate cytidylyltransferase [Clostridia bacterium]|nr:phosphatidate cytidylyltransferase [Clostridia bacterium]